VELELLAKDLMAKIHLEIIKVVVVVLENLEELMEVSRVETALPQQ
jgi:hypothetical protein